MIQRARYLIQTTIAVGSLLFLGGCSTVDMRTEPVQSSVVATAPGSKVPTMAVIPVSVHDRDGVLVERLGTIFSAVWSRETGGKFLPVIPRSGRPFDVVQATSDEARRSGQWGEETLVRFAAAADCDYVLLLWVKHYGFGWEDMDQTKEIRLGFALASTRTGEPVITGQGETVASGRRESFDTLEQDLTLKTAETIISLLNQPDQET